MASLIPSANASGTGSMTLAGPSTNSNQTVNIPDTTGTMMVSGNMPAFSAYANANQNVTSATWTKVQINTEFFDTNSNYDNATNYRFTPTVAGYYQVNFGICFNSSATNPTVIGATLYKNSVQTYGGNQAANPVATALTSFSYVIYMNGSTDYLEVYGYASGGTGTLFFQGQSTAGSAYVASYFNASLVRAS